MITRPTIEKLWKCLREIDAAENLLLEIAKREEEIQAKADREMRTARDIKATDRGYTYQLGIPTRFGDDSGHTLYHVSSDLAEACIKSHLAQKRVELLNLQLIAKVEIGGE